MDYDLVAKKRYLHLTVNGKYDFEELKDIACNALCQLNATNLKNILFDFSSISGEMLVTHKLMIGHDCATWYQRIPERKDTVKIAIIGNGFFDVHFPDSTYIEELKVYNVSIMITLDMGKALRWFES